MLIVSSSFSAVIPNGGVVASRGVSAPRGTMSAKGHTPPKFSKARAKCLLDILDNPALRVGRSSRGLVSLVGPPGCCFCRETPSLGDALRCCLFNLRDRRNCHRKVWLSTWVRKGREGYLTFPLALLEVNEGLIYDHLRGTGGGKPRTTLSKSHTTRPSVPVVKANISLGFRLAF